MEWNGEAVKTNKNNPPRLGCVASWGWLKNGVIIVVGGCFALWIYCGYCTNDGTSECWWGLLLSVHLLLKTNRNEKNASKISYSAARAEAGEANKLKVMAFLVGEPRK